MSDQPESDSQPLPRSRACFVCGVENAGGIRSKFHLDNGRVWAEVVVPDHMVGYDHMVHGGIVATLLDEVMGWAANCHLLGASTTGELTIRYRDAAPVGRPLRLEGEVVRSRGKLCYTEGRLLTPEGVVAASAKGKFMGRATPEGESVSYDLVYEPGDARIFEQTDG